VRPLKLDERKQLILKAIIDDYIFTAEPVGSRTIARKYNLGISPATIRNEMADLEEMGYLEQPYTSAGRIPSDKGYRFYVDSLMKVKRLSKEEIKNISEIFKKITEIEDVIEETVKILSQMTNYASVILGPQLRKSALKHLQIVPLEKGKALVVIVTNTGMVEHRFIKVPENVSDSDLNRISNAMNAKIQGLTIDKITPALLREIQKEVFGCDDILNLAMNILFQSLDDHSENKVYLGGATNLLNLPEFKDIDKAKNFLALLEEKELLCSILTESFFLDKDLIVTIGSENKHEKVQDYSLITATYKVNGRTVGIIGVIGPTRMEYSKVISIVNFITVNMNKIFTELFGEQN